MGKHLVRHYFTALFDLGFLSETATSSLARTITGVAGTVMGIGFISVRVFLRRYSIINDAPDGTLWMQAILSDHVFLLTVPMWIVAFVAVLAGPSLFPDETDFRVLMAMPLSRRLIFGAKLAALVMFVAVFMAIGQAATLPIFIVGAISPWAETPIFLFLPAFLVAGALGAAFAALAVTAIHATLLLVVPRQILLPVSAATGSILLFGLVVALPFLGHVPPFEAGVANSFWLRAFPPAWFLSLERLLVGDLRFASLALRGLIALGIVALIAAAAYVFLYRHFDRVMMRPASDGPGPLHFVATRHRTLPRPALTAVRTFTLLTLRRSVLHQGVVVAISALGAAFVANSILGLDLKAQLAGEGWRRYELVATTLWAPFVLIFVTSLAVRASLLMPIEGRANWVFRMTEQPRTRADLLEGAAWVMRGLGAGLPVLVLLPAQWIAFGPRAIVTSLMAMLVGGLLVEIILFNWRRVPFTCSYLLGKGFVPQLLLKGILAFVAFTTIGSGLSAVARVGRPGTVIVLSAVLLGITLVVRHVRRRVSTHDPLEFEDVLPTETNPLRLSPE